MPIKWDKRHDRRERGRAELLAVARRRFIKGERLDIQTLAAEQGVSRATAYRWLGNNETVLAEVLWGLTQSTMERAEAEATGRGRNRVLSVFEIYFRYVTTFAPLRDFLQNESSLAMTVITTRAYPVQSRMVNYLEDFLVRSASKGAIELPLDAHTMAYALTRVIEAFLYADIVAGEDPNTDSAMQIIGLLLPRPSRTANGGGPSMTRGKRKVTR